ncbi:hypothetical protein [Actinomadura oligospora]|uniref:hypothetical protein n=1 Tax=Actinomadura oligospora TaxID=111804 RepID=UPI0012FBAEF4|nr:hypothetical protein [Actinomadura oligospora]
MDEVAAWAPAARALVAELEARGLTARVLSHGAVWVRNPAGDPASDDRLGALMSPGLNQEVWCRPNGDHVGLWWWWAWAAPARNEPPDLEPLCPVDEPKRAADAIARVLAVPFADAPVS